MENIKVIKIDEEKELSDMNAMRQSLIAISHQMEQMMDSNKSRIDKAEETIRNLLQLINRKEEKINTLELLNQELNRKGDGEKQLVNKLLGDIERLNQDIGWYKKTYEKRSLLGTIKQKLFRDK
jgi:peptidoglycan hydrolase CwlO-like protein